MMEAFPRVTKCNFRKFGPSGTIEKHDALCILAQNILNEKVYIIMWGWLLILSAITFLSLISHVIFVLSPHMVFRWWTFKRLGRSLTDVQKARLKREMTPIR